jgi:hypothetical protein
MKVGIGGLDLARTFRHAGKFARSLLKGTYMAHVEEKIAQPFHEVLDGRHVLPKPMEIIQTLETQHECHGNIEGESPLSTGIAYCFMHDMTEPRVSDPAHRGARPGKGARPLGASSREAPSRSQAGRNPDAYISGIFHVGPFTCMQEGVATAKIEAMAKELRKRKPDLVFPIIHAFFGDSPSANLDSEIAVFTEQCYQKRELLRGTPPGGKAAPPGGNPNKYGSKLTV